MGLFIGLPLRIVSHALGVERGMALHVIFFVVGGQCFRGFRFLRRAVLRQRLHVSAKNLFTHQINHDLVRLDHRDPNHGPVQM